MEGGEPVVIPNAEGARTTASVVAFSKNGERLVGQIAKRQLETNHERTIASIKRDMGTDRKVKIDDKEYTPREISAMILAKLKADAESYLGEPVTQAVMRFRPTSRIPSGRLPRTPARSRAWRYCGSSTSRRQRPSPMGWIRKQPEDSGI